MNIQEFVTSLTEPGTALAPVVLTQQCLQGADFFSAEKTFKRLDFLLHDFKAQFPGERDTLETLANLNDYLFKIQEWKVAPRTPRLVDNLFVSKLFEKRVAAPLVIGLVYRELARRMGIDIHFISFPGHSFLKVLYNHQLYFLNMAQQGRTTPVGELQKLLNERYGSEVFLSSRYLESPTEQQLITVYLNKLKRIYFDAQLWPRLLTVLDLMIANDHRRVVEFKERGYLLLKMGNMEDGARDLGLFLERTEPNPETEQIQSLLKQMEHSGLHPSPAH